MADFPWDKLKAETLRSICTDLGYSRNWAKPIMLTLLNMVQESGVERTLEYEKEMFEAKKEDKTAHPLPETPSPIKRTRGALVVSDYDTRHKRKRITGPETRLSRKSTKALPATSKKSQPRRLTKVRTKAVSRAKAAAPPSSTRREIFDGVLLTPRPNSSKGKEKAEESHDDEGGDEDAEGDVDMDHESCDLIPDPQVESSLASSNKENESPSDDISHTDPLEDEQVPNETVGGKILSFTLFFIAKYLSLDDTSVLENTIQQQTEAQLETEILPAGEEVGVGAGWTVVAQEVAPLVVEEQVISTVETHQTYVHGELTAEDVGNVEEVLRAAVAHGL
ncbi:hypothetical protein C0992_012380 [Termitomyces sp. T32_za158]|nr:hypothetical protein C0992_012380 [Termitomyces sp. T32_za158]